MEEKLKRWLSPWRASSQGRRWTAASLFICCFAAVLYQLWPTQGPLGQKRILMAQRDVPSGSPLSYLFFGMAKESSLKEPFSDDMITDQDLHLFKGAVINLPLRRGDILRRNHLMIVAPPKRVSERIPLGSRAYLLENSAASRLHAGERVDLSFIPTSSPETVMLLAEDALVLEAQGRDELTLALTLEEMESVELARSQGRIGVALRNPTEVRGKGTKKAWSRLRQRRSRTGPDPLRIPVFHEGGER